MHFMRLPMSPYALFLRHTIFVSLQESVILKYTLLYQNETDAFLLRALVGKRLVVNLQFMA